MLHYVTLHSMQENILYKQNIPKVEVHSYDMWQLHLALRKNCLIYLEVDVVVI